MALTLTSHNQATAPLDDSAIARYAPSVFASHPHESRSDKYAYIPTIELIDGLRKEGFEPFFAAQSRCNDDGRREYTKHMLRLRHVSINTISLNKPEIPEIVLLNSHDGSSAYQMTIGILRLVCTNGLIVGNVFDSVKVPHKGNAKDMVIEGAYTVLQFFGTIQAHIAEMKAVTLTPQMSTAYADAAITLRYDTQEKPAPITAEQVLSPRREADSSPDLWSTFNRVQENLVRGGLSASTARGRRTRTRPVNGIDQNVRLNRALWTLTERMGELARGEA